MKMVFQCKDCKIWFRTQTKFNNHKNGVLGLSCTMAEDTQADNLTKQKTNENFNEILSSFDISDDEEDSPYQQQSSDDVQDDIISDDEISEENERSVTNHEDSEIPGLKTPECNEEKASNAEEEARNETDGEISRDADVPDSIEVQTPHKEEDNIVRVEIPSIETEKSVQSPRISELTEESITLFDDDEEISEKNETSVTKQSESQIPELKTLERNEGIASKAPSSTETSVPSPRISESTENSITLSDDEGLDDGEDRFDGQTGEELTLVCVHVDTVKVSGESSVRISQLGCTTALSRLPPAAVKTFFSPVKPEGLEHYLDNYKMEGDLLKALHITESSNGKFEFRAQFEIKRKEKNKIYCSTEEEAREDVRNYLKQFENVVLVGVDRDTVLTLLRTVNEDGSVPVKGILTWGDVLTLSSGYIGADVFQSDSDLEDFYTEHCGPVSGYINTLDVSNFLRRSIEKLLSEYFKKLRQTEPDMKLTWHEVFKGIIQAGITSPENRTGDLTSLDKTQLSVEVYSSFRPAVSTKISMEKMDTVQLSSGGESEDSDIGVIQEKIVDLRTRKKMLLRKRLKQEFENLRKKRQMISRQPAKKRMRIASNAPITISSDSDSDIEDIEGDHHQLLWNLMKRNQDLSILPVRAPALERESRSISLVPNCTICNIEFGNMVALQNHVRQLHLKCVPCNRQFSNLQLAQAHKMLHQHPSQLQQRGRWNVQTDFLLQEDNDYIFGG